MAKINKNNQEKQLINDIKFLIEDTKNKLSLKVNATLTMLYWKIGKRINEELLKNKRAEYGQQIIITLSLQLVEMYGNSFSEKNIRRMMQFKEVFPNERIVVSAIRQLSWTHFIALIPLKQPMQREFYAEMCRIEKWSVKILREKIDSMLYERTAISKRPKKVIQSEIKKLREEDKLSQDLVFRDPYFFDFLGLKDIYSEKNLEDAILRQLENFILELGDGFTFVERQKRIIIDGEDFKIDLVFYHRKLKRLIAIDLKLDKFKAAYKGQMELYLRYLEKNEMQEGEESPIGMILCTEGNKEQIELLELNKNGIKVAEYLTALPNKNLLRKKLHQAVEFSRNRIEQK